MMQDALNELFGRSAIDPQIREAYEAGHIEDTLVECGFPAAFARHLSVLEADGFEAFLALVHSEVAERTVEDEHEADRWPTDGLGQAHEQDSERDTTSGIHQAA